MPMQLPVVGGHEGAGVVVDVGPGVTEVAEGDSVVLSFIPACGRCEPCARGMSNLCVLGAAIIAGPQLDGTFRFHAKGQGLGQMCVLGTFSEYTVVPLSSVIKVDPSTALDTAALVGCGVTTGYGSAVRTGEARDGDTVVIMGVGGIGMNAVQGARIAGARVIVALDPVEYKRSRSLRVRRHPHRGDRRRGPGPGHRPDAGPDGRRLRGHHRLGRGRVRGTGAEPGRQARPGGDDRDPPPHRHLRRHVAVRSDPVRKAGSRVAVRVLEPPARYPPDARVVPAPGSSSSTSS